jgi:hypothetical protein
LRVERGFDPVGLSALGLAAHRDEPGGEPSDDTEPVEHVAGVRQTGVDKVFVGA